MEVPKEWERCGSITFYEHSKFSGDTKTLSTNFATDDQPADTTEPENVRGFGFSGSGNERKYFAYHNSGTQQNKFSMEDNMEFHDKNDVTGIMYIGNSKGNYKNCSMDMYYSTERIPREDWDVIDAKLPSNNFSISHLKDDTQIRAANGDHWHDRLNSVKFKDYSFNNCIQDQKKIFERQMRPACDPPAT